MADGQFTGQGQKVLLAENLGHQPHIDPAVDFLAVGGGDAGAFLPPVLQGEQTEASHPTGGGAGQINADDTALIPWVVRGTARLGAGQFVTHAPIVGFLALWGQPIPPTVRPVGRRRRGVANAGAGGDALTV